MTLHSGKVLLSTVALAWLASTSIALAAVPACSDGEYTAIVPAWTKTSSSPFMAVAAGSDLVAMRQGSAIVGVDAQTATQTWSAETPQGVLQVINCEGASEVVVVQPSTSNASLVIVAGFHDATGLMNWEFDAFDASSFAVAPEEQLIASAYVFYFSNANEIMVFDVPSQDGSNDNGGGRLPQNLFPLEGATDVHLHGALGFAIATYRLPAGWFVACLHAYTSKVSWTAAFNNEQPIASAWINPSGFSPWHDDDSSAKAVVGAVVTQVANDTSVPLAVTIMQDGSVLTRSHLPTTVRDVTITVDSNQAYLLGNTGQLWIAYLSGYGNLSTPVQVPGDWTGSLLLPEPVLTTANDLHGELVAVPSNVNGSVWVHFYDTFALTLAKSTRVLSGTASEARVVPTGAGFVLEATLLNVASEESHVLVSLAQCWNTTGQLPDVKRVAIPATTGLQCPVFGELTPFRNASAADVTDNPALIPGQQDDVVVITPNSAVERRTMSTGQLVWRATMPTSNTDLGGNTPAALRSLSPSSNGVVLVSLDGYNDDTSLVFALDAASGDLQWRSRIACKNFEDIVAVSGSNMAIALCNLDVIGISATNGTALWKNQVVSMASCNLGATGLGAALFLCSNDGSSFVDVLNAADGGKRLWSSSTAPFADVRDAAQVGDDAVAFVGSGRHVWIASLLTGEVRWTKQLASIGKYLAMATSQDSVLVLGYAHAAPNTDDTNGHSNDATHTDDGGSYSENMLLLRLSTKDGSRVWSMTVPDDINDSEGTFEPDQVAVISDPGLGYLYSDQSDYDPYSLVMVFNMSNGEVFTTEELWGGDGVSLWQGPSAESVSFLASSSSEGSSSGGYWGVLHSCSPGLLWDKLAVGITAAFVALLVLGVIGFFVRSPGVIAMVALALADEVSDVVFLTTETFSTIQMFWAVFAVFLIPMVAVLAEGLPIAVATPVVLAYYVLGLRPPGPWSLFVSPFEELDNLLKFLVAVVVNVVYWAVCALGIVALVVAAAAAFAAGTVLAIAAIAVLVLSHFILRVTKLWTVNGPRRMWKVLWRGEQRARTDAWENGTAEDAVRIGYTHFHAVALYQLILKTLPQLILQLANTLALNELTTVAVVSITFSGLSLANSLYMYAYHVGYKRLVTRSTAQELLAAIPVPFEDSKAKKAAKNARGLLEGEAASSAIMAGGLSVNRPGGGGYAML